MGMSGQTQPRNGFGITALVLGLVAIALFWTVFVAIILGVLALIFGLLGRSRAKRGEATNGGMSIAGAVLGAVAVVLAILVGSFFWVSVVQSPAGQNFQQCVEQAGQDRAAFEECMDRFNRELEEDLGE